MAESSVPAHQDLERGIAAEPYHEDDDDRAPDMEPESDLDPDGDHPMLTPDPETPMQTPDDGTMEHKEGEVMA